MSFEKHVLSLGFFVWFLLSGMPAYALVFENKDNQYLVTLKLDDPKANIMLVKIEVNKNSKFVFWTQKETKSNSDDWVELGGDHRLVQNRHGGNWILQEGYPTKTLILRAVSDAKLKEASLSEVQAEYEQTHYEFEPGKKSEALKMADLKTKLANSCGLRANVNVSKVEPSELAIQARAFLLAILEVCKDGDYKKALGKFSEFSFVSSQTDKIEILPNQQKLQFSLSTKILNPKNRAIKILEEVL